MKVLFAVMVIIVNAVFGKLVMELNMGIECK